MTYNLAVGINVINNMMEELYYNLEHDFKIRIIKSVPWGTPHGNGVFDSVIYFEDLNFWTHMDLYTDGSPWFVFGYGTPALNKNNSMAVQINPTIDHKLMSKAAIVTDEKGIKYLCHKLALGGNNAGTSIEAHGNDLFGNSIFIRNKTKYWKICQISSTRAPLGLARLVHAAYYAKIGKLSNGVVRDICSNFGDKSLLGNREGEEPQRHQRINTQHYGVSAAEGERRILERKVLQRSRKLVVAALERDGYRCLCCGYRISVGDRHIIECHHKKELSGGKRVTCVDDLASLCPNCHTAVHSQKPAISVDKWAETMASLRRSSGSVGGLEGDVS